MPVADEMFQARIVGGGETPDRQKTATIGWPDGRPIEFGAVVVVMSISQFDALTQTAKSLGRM